MTAAASLLFVALAQTAPPAPARDTPFLPPAGTSSISGRIVTDEPAPKPVRRAVVTLNGDGLRTGWTFVTDETGTFSFDSLPAGRYSMRAQKPGLVTMNYGALKPDRPGASIALKDNQRAADLVIRMPLGAVISGTLVDHLGVPIPQAPVGAFLVSVRNGERVSTPVRNGITDDRGYYRVFGLTAGEYVLVSDVRPVAVQASSIRAVTEREIEAALRDPSAAAGARPPVPAEDPVEVTQAPVYYPGTSSLADAATIRLAAGEERTGVDFAVQYVAAVRVEGRILGPDGKPVNLMMSLTQTDVKPAPTSYARPSTTDGTFAFSGVPPGQYVITARTAVSGSSAPATGPQWARADITVAGQKVTGLDLVLRQGADVSGAVQFESGAAPQTAVSVSLEPIVGKGDIAQDRPVVTSGADGTFSFLSVPAGKYRVRVSPVTPSAVAAWSAKSAIAQGRNALDEGLIVSNENIDGLAVTLTDKVIELSGVLQDSTGRAAPDYYIIVFPTDRQFWFAPSRRIKTARPSLDGKFLVRDLPPGEYRVAAVTDVETNLWFEPSFLEQLLSASASVTLAEGEKKVFDLKIGGVR